MTTDNLLTLLASIPKERIDELRTRLPGKTILEYSALVLLGDVVTALAESAGIRIGYPTRKKSNTEKACEEMFNARTVGKTSLAALKPKPSSPSNVDRALELIDEIQDLWPDNDFAASIASYIEDNDFVTRRQLEGLESVLRQAQAKDHYNNSEY